MVGGPTSRADPTPLRGSGSHRSGGREHRLEGDRVRASLGAADGGGNVASRPAGSVRGRNGTCSRERVVVGASPRTGGLDSRLDTRGVLAACSLRLLGGEHAGRSPSVAHLDGEL